MGRTLKLRYPPGATPLDPDETAGLIPTSISTQGELNAFEQANIIDADRWAFARKRKGLLTERFVRELHRRMFDQVWKWAGSYRRSDKSIGVAWPQIPTKIGELCLDAQYWIDHRTYPWDELGARFHHRLVSIHPFPNGNGRHARLMADLLVVANDQPIFTWGSQPLSSASTARERYIAALKAADRHDCGPLIAFARG